MHSLHFKEFLSREISNITKAERVEGNPYHPAKSKCQFVSILNSSVASRSPLTPHPQHSYILKIIFKASVLRLVIESAVAGFLTNSKLFPNISSKYLPRVFSAGSQVHPSLSR